MGAIIDLTGKKFNRLLVVRKTEKRDKNGSVYWMCECDCGNKVELNSKNIRAGLTKSCGCLNNETRKARTIDMVGKKFGYLTVVSKGNEQDDYRNNFYNCECRCGNTTKVRGYALRNGATRSCGCLRIETIRKRSHIDLEGEKFGRLLVLSKSDKKSKRSEYWLCKCDCGNTHEVLGENLRAGKIKSCGCLQREEASKLSGDNSPHYKKELTAEDRILGRNILGKDSIRVWKNSVYKRDGYVCAICGEKGGVLNAHHLDGWNWCKEKRFNIDNGVTLCKVCHNEFHNIYGRGDNTKEQFREFKISKGATT